MNSISISVVGHSCWPGEVYAPGFLLSNVFHGGQALGFVCFHRVPRPTPGARADDIDRFELERVSEGNGRVLVQLALAGHAR